MFQWEIARLGVAGEDDLGEVGGHGSELRARLLALSEQFDELGEDFFAVGAAHYSGDIGLIAQLSKKGFKITRLSPADAASITKAR